MGHMKISAPGYISQRVLSGSEYYHHDPFRDLHRR